MGRSNAPDAKIPHHYTDIVDILYHYNNFDNAGIFPQHCQNFVKFQDTAILRKIF